MSRSTPVVVCRSNAPTSEPLFLRKVETDYPPASVADFWPVPGATRVRDQTFRTTARLRRLPRSPFTRLAYSTEDSSAHSRAAHRGTMQPVTERTTTLRGHPERVEEWLTIARAPGLTGRRLNGLLEQFGDVSRLCRANVAALRASGLPAPCVDAIRKPDRRLRKLDLDWLAGERHHLVSREDETYPALLAEIPDAPPVLFATGRPGLLNVPLVALVGTRRPSHSGRSIAAEFATGLCAAGLGIASGLAVGIDASAHAAALDAGGDTVAVLGCGIDRHYPPRNAALRERLEREALVVSEFAPGTPPLATNFPRRNRIISGLSLGVLVVEAARRSGSLITARLAAEQGRDVFAVPGSVRNPVSAGCHQLLRDGAALVEQVGDLLAELQPGLLGVVRRPAPGVSNVGVATGDDAASVLAALGFEAVPMDVLLQRTTLTPPQLSSILLSLEISGAVVAHPGGNYERVYSSRG